MRARIAAVAFLFVLSGLPLAPGSAATSHSVSWTDGAGDVVFGAGAGDLGPAPSPEMGAFLDLLDVSLGRETGQNVTFVVRVADMQTPPPSAARLMRTVEYALCFTYGDLDFQVTPKVVHLGESEATDLPGTLAVVDGACGVRSPPERVAEVALSLEDVRVDVAAGQLHVRVQRKDLADLHALAGRDVRYPQAGDALSGLFAETFASYGIRDQPLLVASDRAPDSGTSPDAFVFEANSFNDLLEVRVQTNTIDRGRRVPDYSVDAGGFQAVPVEVVNRANGKKVVNLSAEVVEGDAGAWNLTLAPFVEVPGLDAAGNEGLRTVTLIVEPRSGVAHSEKIKVRVNAAFRDQPQVNGHAEVNIIAIVPPGPENKDLWLHVGTRGSGRALWMNALKDDPVEKPEQSDLSPESQQGAPTRGVYIFSMDVQPSKDLLLDARRDILVNLSFSGLAPNPTDPQNPGQMSVEVIAVLLNGEDRTIGEARAEYQVTSDRQAYTLRMVPRVLDRADKEVRVEAGSDRLVKLYLDLQPKAPPLLEAAVSQPTPGSSFTFHAKGSGVWLPITRTEARGLTNLSEKGALVSLNLADHKDLHLNPGRTKVVNFTVLNEGVFPDTVSVSFAFNRSQGWGLRVVPRTTFTLAPGVGDDFSVFVTANPNAEEDDEFALEVIARSKLDPTVVARQRLVFITTLGVDIPDEGGLSGKGSAAEKGKKGGIPGLEAPVAALALLGAALLGSRPRKGKTG